MINLPEEKCAIDDISCKNTTRASTTFTNRDLKLMTKRKLLNLAKKEYEKAEGYLKERLEHIDFNDEKRLTREQLIGCIKTLTEGVDTLPSNVESVLRRAKPKLLRRLVSDTKIIKPSVNCKKEAMLDTLRQVYKSRPHLYMGQKVFNALAEKKVPRNRFPSQLYTTLKEYPKRAKKKPDQQEEEKKMIDSSQAELEEVKKANLLKYEVILCKFKHGMTEIEIAQQMGVSYANVVNWVTKFDKYGDVNKQVKRRKKCPKINTEMQDFIKSEIAYNNDIISKELVPMVETQFKKRVSLRTVYRYLTTIGSFKRPKENVVLSHESKRKRLQYCTKMSTQSFKNIVFTDECSVELRRNSIKIFVLKGRQPIKRYVNGKTKIMVFGGISMQGKVFFQVLPQKQMINWEYYCQEMLPPLIENADIKHKKWRLMQDNAGPHKKKETMDFLREQGIKVVDHPPNSPDLNPIELVWNMLKRRIEKFKPRTLTDLILYAKRAWESIEDNKIIACINRLRRVMRDVIEAGGDNVFISKPRRFDRVNYAEPDFLETGGEDDPNFYNKCDEKREKRKLLSMLREQSYQLEELKQEDYDCESSYHASKKVLETMEKKLMKKLKKKFGMEEEELMLLRKKTKRSDNC